MYRHTIKIFVMLMLLHFSCTKDWLDVKPDNSLVVPTTIEDYQALLDNTNTVFSINQPALGEMASDDFYIQTNTWLALNAIMRNAYIWSEDGTYVNDLVSDWSRPYAQVLHCNIILEGISKITPDAGSLQSWKNVRGSALFLRALNFFNLSQVFAKPYEVATATMDLGIPIKLTTNVNDISVRASLEQTYGQVIRDLVESTDLLPNMPLYKTRPSRPAAFALLARVYLSMQDYDKALQFADSSLALYNTLMDFNGDQAINQGASFPISALNKEVMFYSAVINYTIFTSSRMIVDSILYRSYDPNDMRRTLFYFTNGGQIRYRGSYNGNVLLYNGLASDEMFLTRAECLARQNDIVGALTDLNALLSKRYRTGFFVPLTATGQEEAIRKILLERRKELCFRGLRWMDLRRLNLDIRFQVIQKKVVDNQTYILVPGDLRYVLPIPNREIEISGIEQNPR